MRLMLKFRYRFDSDYVDEKYRCYDGREFDYLVEWGRYLTSNRDVIIPIDDEEYVEYIKDLVKQEAMEWYADKHYIMTKEEYEANEADNYNDERMCD